MNTRRLFVASCVALVTTSMVFSIRGDIVDALGADFQITKEQMGEILSPAFWGFALSIIFAGSLVDWLGMRNLLLTSSLGYIVAIVRCSRCTRGVIRRFRSPEFSRPGLPTGPTPWGFIE